MKSATLLQFSLALLFANVVHAQDLVKDPEEIEIPSRSERIATGLVVCACSRSGRYFLETTSKALESGIRTVYRGVEADRQKGENNTIVNRNARAAGRVVFNECIGRDGYEACVNADIAMRSLFTVPFCFYDKVSRKNLNVDSRERIVTVGKCNARSDTTSPSEKLPERIPSSSSRVQNRFLFCICSPTRRGFSTVVGNAYKQGINGIAENVRREQEQGVDAETINKNVGAAGIKLLTACSRKYGVEACTNADAALRETGVSLCSYDKQTGKNLKGFGSELVLLPKCTVTGHRSPDVNVASPGAENGAPTGNPTATPTPAGFPTNIRTVTNSYTEAPSRFGQRFAPFRN